MVPDVPCAVGVLGAGTGLALVSKTLTGLQIVLTLGMLRGVAVQKEAQRHPFL